MPWVCQEGKKRPHLQSLQSEQAGGYGNVLADIQEVHLPVHREQMAEDIEGCLVEQRKMEAVADNPEELGAAVVRIVSCEDHPWNSLTGNSPCCHRPVEAGGWVSGMGAEKVVYCLL